ncbi:hypothetical protein SL054_001395 [Flavobacterium psychrophilum]|uniref:hypothetical protein n=2 Tax=Flavobacterium psychrophilum TaxID=96345 RepID=UPI000B7C26C4|nr:hypothetical protein [Flavobacterium psychrophilum]EKT4499162.1 hypothetical protein [Flavobacterium psychrophilum]ELM3650821.1 hypothetical protein [Flavobacterium psychrophilum]ELM3671475.1 hypothetical protein [Flavobacterium psychrophilum]ELM3726009.1 hypothetical protein [Flavobacterium psychrophilum]ELY1992059.1 hypothetical protein [Flavobacterium psychrophilum]
MMNLFEKAVNTGELLKFALGQGEYFILDREYDGHWIHGSWINYILPYINEKEEVIANIDILNLFKSILNAKDIDLEKKGDVLLYHLHVYYYQKQEGKINSDALGEINEELLSFFDNYLGFLNKTSPPKIAAVQDAISLIKSRGGLIT